MASAQPWPEPQSLPSPHWPELSGFLLFLSCHWLGAGFPPPSAFFCSPSLLPHPSDRSSLPTPCSSGREEFRGEKFPRSLDQEGREEREGKGEREEKKEELLVDTQRYPCPCHRKVELFFYAMYQLSYLWGKKMSCPGQTWREREKVIQEQAGIQASD